jgi:cytochrome P450
VRLEDLPEIDLGAEELQHDMDRAMAHVRPLMESGGLARSVRGIELLTYDRSAALMRDQRYSVAINSRLAGVGLTEGAAYEGMTSLLFNREGSRHTRMRRACAPWFSLRGVERFRSDVRGWVDEWLDEVPDEGAFDFHERIGRRLPATLFCSIVGAPLDDWELFARLSEENQLTSQAPDPKYRRIVEDAAVQTTSYLKELIELRRSTPGDDLISFMLRAEGEGTIDEGEMLGVIWNVLVGSTDTTNSQINLNLATLADHPDQWAILKADPDLVATGVNELLRYNPGLYAVMRSPLEPLDFEGIELTPGDTLWPSVFAPNNDPAAFEDPRTLDVTRPLKRVPLNFGSGVHGCLGRMFTLLEQQEVLKAVLSRWDEVEIVDSEFTGAMYALKSERMTVRFTRDQRVPATAR